MLEAFFGGTVCVGKDENIGGCTTQGPIIMDAPCCGCGACKKDYVMQSRFYGICRNSDEIKVLTKVTIDHNDRIQQCITIKKIPKIDGLLEAIIIKDWEFRKANVDIQINENYCNNSGIKNIDSDSEYFYLNFHGVGPQSIYNFEKQEISLDFDINLVYSDKVENLYLDILILNTPWMSKTLTVTPRPDCWMFCPEYIPEGFSDQEIIEFAIEDKDKDKFDKPAMMLKRREIRRQNSKDIPSFEDLENFETPETIIEDTHISPMNKQGQGSQGFD